MSAAAQPPHPLLPSGDWEGFYVYQQGPGSEQHKMEMRLDFENGIISGSGSDDVAGHSWRGNYDLKSMSCEMAKIYPTHTVNYQGSIDENGIWGTWQMHGWTGGFHIWPKKQKKEEEAHKETLEMKLVEVKKLQNNFVNIPKISACPTILEGYGDQQRNKVKKLT